MAFIKKYRLVKAVFFLLKLFSKARVFSFLEKV